MRLFGIIGYPLGHSFSRQYFSDKFANEHLVDCAYENFPLDTIAALPALLRSHPDLCGFNVTIPYKEQVLPYLHHATALVRDSGACNCVKITNGKLIGFNTDIIGFERALEQHFPALPGQALVLGTGGAAKAVEFVLKKRSIRYVYVSRHPQAGQLSYSELTEKIINNHRLIIQTTPVGMYPNVEAAPRIPYQALTPQHCLFDLIYNPAETQFLKEGKAKGAAICNGMDMLLFQAEENWKIWNA